MVSELERKDGQKEGFVFGPEPYDRGHCAPANGQGLLSLHSDSIVTHLPFASKWGPRLSFKLGRWCLCLLRIRMANSFCNCCRGGVCSLWRQPTLLLPHASGVPHSVHTPLPWQAWSMGIAGSGACNLRAPRLEISLRLVVLREETGIQGCWRN